MQLLLMLRQTVESSDRAAVLDFGGERSLAQLGSYGDVIFAHDKSNPLGISLCWNLLSSLKIQDPNRPSSTLFSGEKICFGTDIRNTAQEKEEKDKLFVQAMWYQLSGQKFEMHAKGASDAKKPRYELSSEPEGFSFKRTVGRAWDLPPPAKFYGFPDQVFAYFQNAGFLSELQLQFEQLFGRLYYLGPLRDFPQRHYVWSGSQPADMGRRGERAVDAILASRERGRYISPGYKCRKQSLEERVAYWLKYLGLIQSFTVKAIAEGSNLYEVRVRRSANSSEVLITDVGFGVSQVLPVLVLCYYVPEGSTILLEQPEIHLHPSVQSGLADVLVDVIKNRKLQVVVESHSEHLLRRLQRRIADETLSPDDVDLYFCEVAGSESQLTKLDVNLFGSVTNWPKDFFGDEFSEMAEITKAAMQRIENKDK